ncbi:MAG: PilZ domain-containing protein [Pseudomonadota bacterium]
MLRSLVLTACLVLVPAWAVARPVCEAIDRVLVATDLLQIETTQTQWEVYAPSVAAALSDAARLAPAAAAEDDAAATILRGIAAQAAAPLRPGAPPMSRADATRLGDEARALARSRGCAGVAEIRVPGRTDVQRAPPPGPARLDGPAGAAGATPARLRAVVQALWRETRTEALFLSASAVMLLVVVPLLMLRDRHRRRRARRHPYFEPTTLRVDGRAMAARFFDVSLTGAAVLVANALPPGRAVEVDLNGLSRRARVVRQAKGFAGLAFDRPLSEADLARVLAASPGRGVPARKRHVA